jgi:signal transduction histidine kinase
VRAEADAALAQADRLETTVDELLALARGRPGGDGRPADVARVVAERADGWRGQYSAAGRQLVVVAGDGPAPASVSEAAVGQAVEALVDNAFRHGSGTATVEVHPYPDHVEVLVGDEGQGVEPAQARLIFERHVSLEGGTGVGLALARALVEAQGGRVDLVRARPPLFRVLLPADGATTPAGDTMLQ